MVALITCWFVRKWACENEKINTTVLMVVVMAPNGLRALVVHLIAERLCHSLMFIKFFEKVVVW